jgi:hypothetical protein
MSQAAQIRIQDDVIRAFSVKPERMFYRKNDQVYAIVGMNPALMVISDIWFDTFDTQEEFRAVLQHICDKFRSGAFRYWLADLRFLRSGFAESEDWLVKTLMPEVIKAGLVREAVVLPDAAIHKEGEDAYTAASRSLREVADGRVRGFTDINLAKKWLLDGDLPA